MMRQNGLRFVVVVLVAALIAVARPGVAAAGERVDDTPRVVVIATWEPELAALLDKLEEGEPTVIQGRTFYVGQMGGMDVVVTFSGMSMVNAAVAAEIALREFNPVAIIGAGIAGGMNPELQIGDVVIPEQWAEYLESVFARQTEDGYTPGAARYVEEIEPYGMIYPRAVDVTREGGEADAEEQVVWFGGDPGLLQLADELAGTVTLDACTPDGQCLDQDPRVVVGGSGVSAPVFMDNADVRAWLASAFDAEAVDMESAAIAQVAYTGDVPFLAIRSLSDLGGGPGENDVDVFSDLAAGNAAVVVEALLEAMAAQAPDGGERRMSASYFSIFDEQLADLEGAPWQQVDRLYIAFATLDDDGNLTNIEIDGAADGADARIREVVAAYREARPDGEVYISSNFGEDEMDPRYLQAAQDPGQFADSVVDFLQEYDLDGYDMDWETHQINDYGDELRSLLSSVSEAFQASELTPRGRHFQVTATIWPGVHDPDLVGSLEGLVDGINLMTYGPSDHYDLVGNAGKYAAAGFPYTKMLAGVESEFGYNNAGGVDTAESVAAKAQFVRDNDLMGMFSWRLDNDYRTEDGKTEGGPATYQVAGWVYDEMGK